MRRNFLLFFLLVIGSQAQGMDVSGTLLPSLKTKIGTEVSGRVQEVLMSTGEYVSKGQVLAKLDPLNFEIDVQRCKIACEQASIAYDDAQKHFTRMKTLFEKESAAIPKHQYDAAESQAKQAKLQLMQARLNLKQTTERLSETEIKAPYAGVISGAFVDPGESVLAMGGAPLFEIMNTDELVFEFTVPQTELDHVQTGQMITSPLCKEGGVITTIFPQVDEMSRSLKCHVVIPNSSHALKPGLFFTGELHLHDEVDAP